MTVQDSSSFIPLLRVDVQEAEIEEVVATLRSGWLTTGARVRRFEEACKAYLGCSHALALSSGTAALHLALSALELGPGDEVITTPLTFAATVNAILYVGATPVLADVDPETLQLSPRDVEAKRTPRTRALLPVHYGGAAADLASLEALARPHGIEIVEDAALAMGARVGEDRIGARSRAACFSFHPAKHVTTGEGGLLVTSDEALDARARLRSWHGIDKTAMSRYEQKGTWRYAVQDLGFKYNMSDIQAAMGIHQLARLEQSNAARRAAAAEYDAALDGLPGVQLPPPRDRAGVRLPYWLVLDPERYDRDRFIEALTTRGVGSGVHYIPIHLHPYYQRRFGWSEGSHPVCERAYRGLVSLPLFPTLSGDERRRVVEAAHAALEVASR